MADNSIGDIARESGAEALLWAIPFAWLMIGLGEELVFRGTIQYSLEGEFSTRSATLVSSVIFRTGTRFRLLHPGPGRAGKRVDGAVLSLVDSRHRLRPAPVTCWC